jgi:hypothetical protein
VAVGLILDVEGLGLVMDPVRRTLLPCVDALGAFALILSFVTGHCGSEVGDWGEVRAGGGDEATGVGCGGKGAEGSGRSREATEECGWE